MFRKKKAKGHNEWVKQNRLQLFLLQKQRALAGWLQQKSEKLSLSGKKRLFWLLLLLSVCLNAYLVWDSLMTGNPNKKINLSGSIRVPDLPKQPKKTAKLTDSILESRIERFTAYLDSLELSPSGRKLKDSMLRARPGLMDSITIWTQLKND